MPPGITPRTCVRDPRRPEITRKENVMRPRLRSIVAALVMVLALTATTGLARAGGNVMPPTAQPRGYSLTDMAAAVANFSISGNDVSFLPRTPFQIIYNRPGRTFTIRAGTPLYLKFF